MTKYRKKPVVIEAIQWTGKNWKEVWKFINDKRGDMRSYAQQPDKTIAIRT